ncbi:3786_t:CDS:2 [Diversispora eburnea]|uniref:3786_t:CDS:1 n=1 Tax=Diversispora eburnea TaxID=1213867 RepID=A0A9N9C8X2_9GLOM|nr:3786_t:CDS:2 [Diversispora eburnea]
MRTLTPCGGKLVFSSFVLTISSKNEVTYFLKGSIPEGLNQPTVQSTIYFGFSSYASSESRVTCYDSSHERGNNESCIIDSGSITFHLLSDYAGDARETWEKNPTLATNYLKVSFYLWSQNSVIQGCVLGSPIGSIPLTSEFQIAYNALFLSGVIVGLISSFVSFTLIKGINTSTTNSKSLESSDREKSTVSQPPSVYDIFRAAQFFVTTALLSLTHLPDNYRNLISKLSWTIGLPSFSESLSNIADDQIRKEICDMSNPPSSGFITSGRIMNIPGYNSLFCVIVQFSIVLAIALVITLLLGLFSRLWKSLQKKWSIVKTIANNIHLLVLGGMFRVDLSHDRDAFNTPVHTFIYGALYTQYRDHSEKKQTCLWFFAFTFAYDVIRAIATGGARQSGYAQTGSFIRKDKDKDNDEAN